MEKQLEQLTALMVKQAEMTQLAQEEARRREERLSSMLEGLVGSGAGAVGNSGGSASRLQNGDTEPRVHRRFPQGTTPAPHLSSSVSLREFDAWRHKLEGYAMLTGITTLTHAEQRSALMSLLDDDWTRALRYGLNVSDTADLKTILDAMEAYLRGQRNIILDRRDFYSRTQEIDENFDDFLCSIKEISAFCDFCTACMENRLHDRIVVGIRDEEALKRMLEEKNLTLQRAIDICRASENANANRAVIRGSTNAALAKLSQYKKDRKKLHPGVPKEEKCFRCGRERHSEMKLCKAINQQCKGCGKKGHFAVVCKSSKPGQQKQVSQESKSSKADREVHRIISDVYINSTSSRPTPRIRVHTSHPAGERMIYWTPDSGAEATVMGLDVARSLGINEKNMDPPNIINLCAAGRQPLTCIGAFTSRLQLGEKYTTTVVFVIKEVRGALLSWFDSIALAVLPRNFPSQIKEAEVSEVQVSSTFVTRKEASRGNPTTTGRRDVNVSAETPVPLPRWPYTCSPTPDERAEHADMLIKAFPQVFGESETLREMHGGPMHIELKEDARSFAVTTPRVIPYCWRAEIKTQLDELLARDIVSKVDYPTEWCHPIVPVPKSSGVRLCVDLTALNRYVRRPTYPVRSPHDAIASMNAGASWFTTLDAKMGYFQIKIAEEDQDLTCYKFKRAVMGLISSGDEYNRRGDWALGDLPQTVKIVDDILAHDYTYRDHLAHIISILQRCEKFGVTLNPDKFKFARTKVDFCGYSISQPGYTVDSRKVKAIADFKTPRNITDLRSFMGLCNQLGGFSSEVAHAAQPLRDLLKPRNEWCWTDVHDVAFQKVKDTLVAPPILAHFDAAMPTMLQTDASRLHGLGFALLQRHGENWRLIQCGSRFLIDTETRYAVIEVEMAAVLWAVKKCSTYLAGLPHFDLVIDHRPLVLILNCKLIGEIENPRLQRMKEKLSAFSFTARWQKGSSHSIPDALSRALVQGPTEEDEVIESGSVDPLHAAVVSALSSAHEDGILLAPLRDKTLEKVHAASLKDPEYGALRDVIMKGFPEHRHSLQQELRPYWGVRSMLAVDEDFIVYGPRLLIPHSLRRETLQRLHDGHQGIDRTKRRERQTVFWPGIDRDIENIVSSCTKCQTLLPKQQNEPLWQDDERPSRVFESVSADFFHVAGRTFLVYIDRLSGWPYVSSCQGSASAAHLVRLLRPIFSDTGVPVVLRTDGGPQFAPSTFRRFLARWGVEHRITSPYNPRANGHAEAAVKTVKKLIMTTTSGGQLDEDDFARGLLELRNTPRADGRSPAQVLFGHPLRSSVPAHHHSFAEEWQRAAEECDAKAERLREQAKVHHDATARALPKLSIGTHVDIQDHISQCWDKFGVIVGIGSHRDYLVKMGSGRILRRNRKFLRPHRPFLQVNSPDTSSSVDAHRSSASPGDNIPSPATSPRRSKRLRRHPDRLVVQWD